MKKTPISLIIDDPAPRVFVFYEHSFDKQTKDGRPLVDNVPNEFLFRFCDAIERYGIKGKYSVVPIPGGRGRIDEGIPGFEQSEIQEWIDTVKGRVGKYFDFCPEVLTHAGYIDLATGKMMDEWENKWSFRQTHKELTPYISLALEILKNVGINATGVTSPWDFGVKVEDEYAKAIALAMDKVHGKKESWYFCRDLFNQPNAKPWIAYKDEEHTVVSIPATINDKFWQAMDTTDTSEEYVRSIADYYISEDGKSGRIIEVLDSNGWPILLSHWQSLFSNGAGTGLRILELIAQRVEEHLSDRVEWTAYGDMMKRTLEENK